MDMLRKNGAGPDCGVRFPYQRGETATDGSRLQSGETNGRVMEGVLGSAALFPIVRLVGDGLSCLGRGRRSKAKQFPRADEIRPRTARIVRQPEPIRPEDDVIPQNHASPSLV